MDASHAKVFKKNDYKLYEILELETNFNYKKIKSLYSNLTSLNILQLYELRKNYIKLNYSITDINFQFMKLISYPLFIVNFYFCLIDNVQYKKK